MNGDGVEVQQFAPEAGPYDSPEVRAAREFAAKGRTIRVRIIRDGKRYLTYLSREEVLQLAEQLLAIL